MDTENYQRPTTKQERHELRRQEKQQFHASQVKNRTTKRAITLAIIFFMIGALGYGLYYLASRPGKLRPGETFPILGREHIQDGAKHPAYNSNPPISGSHYSQPADWGVYQKELPDEQLVHNLERGDIWISYKDVDDKTKSDLGVISKRYSGSVIITPRSANDAKITLASWGRLLKLDGFDEARIVTFIKANKNKSPESLAR